MTLATLVCVACGDIYRPVVIPCSAGGGIPGCPVEPPPVPSNFHTVFAISANVPDTPGGALQIDVSGDSIIAESPVSATGEPNSGLNLTHATIIPNFTRVFVASAGSTFSGGLDVVASFIPAAQFGTSGFGAITTVALPAGSLPVFLNSTQNGFMYVADFGTNTVSAINASLSVVSNSATVGVNPVSLAELPSAQKLYVANQGDNSVSSLNPVDMTANVVSGFTGVSPVWTVARGDSQKVYVLTQGDGQLVTFDANTDTVIGSAAVGAGANFMLYDPHLNRIYVTNPLTSTVYVFSDTGGANDTPSLLKTISFASGSAPCPLGCSPESVTALADGSRFYVASYQTAVSCPDPVIGSVPCVIPGITVFDATNLTPNITPALTLLTWAPAGSTAGPFATGQYAVAPVASCATVTPYSPAMVAGYVPARFRVFTTASEDSTRVYVSMCDAGAIAVINTTDGNANGSGSGQPADTVVTDLPAAFGNGPAQGNGEPANQNPLFMLAGQ